MKRNLITKGIIVSVALSAVLTGCGTTTGSTTSDSKTITGKAIDGYLQNAVVCLDLNKDGYCQANSEPMTTTDIHGAFSLDITPTQQEHANFDEAMLVIFGGVDVDTGKDFTGKLLAPNDGSAVLNVSPITTLVAKNVQKALKTDGKLTREQIQAKIAEAKKKVADSLDIPEEEIGLDPIAKKNAGDDKLIRTSLKIQKSIEAQLLAAKVKDREFKEKTEDLYAALADGLDDMSEGEKGLKKLYEKAAQKALYKEALAVQDSQEMLDIADKISGNLDLAFDHIEDGDLEKIAAVTRDDLDAIKEGAESGNLSSTIQGIVLLPEDDRFKPAYDWAKKYIEHDLKEIGIRPTVELVNQLKDVYGDDIEAGMLFKNTDKLKDNESLSVIYQRILTYKEKQEVKKEAEEAQHSGENSVDLKAIFSGKTLFIVDGDNEDSREFQAKVLQIQFNDDVTVATDNEGGEVSLKIKDNAFYVDTGDDTDVLVYKGETDKAYLFYGDDGEIMKFFKEADSAEAFKTELQKKFQSMIPIYPIDGGDTTTPDNGNSTGEHSSVAGQFYSVAGLTWTQVSPQRVTYTQAKNMCSAIGPDWRLPTLTELEENAAEIRQSGILSKEAQSSVVWSSTENSGFWFDPLHNTTVKNEGESYYISCVK